MNQQVNLANDSFSFVAEAVSVDDLKDIGRQTSIPLRKVIFRVPEKDRFQFVAVDFVGQNSHIPAMVKAGKNYMVTVTYRGSSKEGKVYMSFQGQSLTQL
jgi:hypothetical protein